MDKNHFQKIDKTATTILLPDVDESSSVDDDLPVEAEIIGDTLVSVLQVVAAAVAGVVNQGGGGGAVLLLLLLLLLLSAAIAVVNGVQQLRVWQRRRR